jgi:caspase-like apoptosis-related cysteine protease
VATKEDHRNSDCILFVFMTHGYNGKLYAKDTHYNPDPLRLLFTSDKCPSLAGKPKIFIIQACRGNSPDFGTSLTPRPKHSSHRVSSSDETDGHKSEPFKMATHADFLIANSTVSSTTNTS